MSNFLGNNYKPPTNFKTDASILLQPNIIKPLHGMNPRTILGRKWWDVHRKEAYASTGYRCLACGIEKQNALYHHWLEGHEDYTIDFNKYQYRLNRVVPLCHACHNFIHDGRLTILYEKGEISQRKFNTITNHGNSVLSVSNLPLRNTAWWTAPEYYREMFPENVGTWDKWHILIEGKKYFSKFKDYGDWYSFYNE